MSTSHSLFELVKGITTSLDNNKYDIGIFGDPWKAFDTVYRDILANYFYYYGIRSIATGINRTLVSKTRPLNPYQLTHDTAMQVWTSDIHIVAWRELTGGARFI